MATMFKDVDTATARAVNIDALKSEVRMALINQKVNACPIAMRMAWHMSGTYDKTNGTGGSDGATIRFAPEKDDGANAGLHIIRDLLEPVKRRHPEVSYADLYVLASAMAIEFTGGPAIPINLGRKDAADGAKAPENGRLPDATQGAAHLRDVFGRMGFNDQEIVALSGGHTLGSAHRVRSGFDGQWTTKPLQFDNEYFRNLVYFAWSKRKWDGPTQYQGGVNNALMMLPTDIALLEDGAFRVHVDRYANDENVFRAEFAAAYAKLMALGCPEHVVPGTEAAVAAATASKEEELARRFRHLAMHGNVAPLRALVEAGEVVPDRLDHDATLRNKYRRPVMVKIPAGSVPANCVDKSSNRNALHFAAFWGHLDMAAYLVDTCAIDVAAADFNGDTPLHDAAAHGHTAVVQALVARGADHRAVNKAGMTPLQLAEDAGHTETVDAIKAIPTPSQVRAKARKEANAWRETLKATLVNSMLKASEDASALRERTIDQSVPVRARNWAHPETHAVDPAVKEHAVTYDGTQLTVDDNTLKHVPQARLTADESAALLRLIAQADYVPPTECVGRLALGSGVEPADLHDMWRTLPKARGPLVPVKPDEAA